MTGRKIVPLKREEPHLSGEAVCTGCGHEWVAVAPVGMTQLECPECGSSKGLFKHPFGPAEGELSYECSCGSDLFFIKKTKHQASGAVYCRGCGVEAVGWFE